MANKPDYRCDTCLEKTERDLLTVKKIQFLGMGAGAKTLKTRVDSWQCPRCIVNDPHWQQAVRSRYAADAPSTSPVLTPDNGSASMVPSTEGLT